MCPCSLDRKEHVLCRYGVFKVRVGSSAHEKAAADGGLSKLNSVPHRSMRSATRGSTTRSTLFQASRLPRTARASRRSRTRTLGSARRDRRLPECKCSGIPRKEVIQPQLPLRLPCYDFTPIIDPTFDGCLLLRG
jgi:hypothetical protein